MPGLVVISFLASDGVHRSERKSIVFGIGNIDQDVAQG